MNFDPQLFLKWLPVGDPSLEGKDYFLVRHCALLAKRADGQITGFTVFQTKDLNESFFGRLTARVTKPENAGIKFELYFPPFLKNKVETLIGREISSRVDQVSTPVLFLKIVGGKLAVRSKLRVVSVDDSPVLLQILKHLMGELKFVDVVGQTSDPTKAVDTIMKLRPDVVTMDIQMPKMTGVEVVKALLPKQYFPVIVVSSLELRDGSLVFEALMSGAHDYIQKPSNKAFGQFLEDLEIKLLQAAESNYREVRNFVPSATMLQSRSTAKVTYQPNTLWCLGASTGGTQALARVFTALPTNIPPTVVVQHIPPVFSKSFADSMNDLCPFTVKEAEDGELLKPDHVYIAPGGFQMGIETTGPHLKIKISDAAPVNRFKPSVDFLFETISHIARHNIVAGILTGMGKDGAQGLLSLKQKGAFTFAQNEKSSAVYGMPRAAAELKAAQAIYDLNEIASALVRQSTTSKKVA